MKYCNKCKADVIGDLTFCPLCQNELQIKGKIEENIYPSQVEQRFNNHMVLKVFGFIALIVSIIAVFLNIVLPNQSWWSVIVVLSMGCIWLSIAVAINKHRNIVKYVLYQAFIISVFMVFLDYATGANGWAMTFVVPIILTIAMCVMYVISKVLHLQVGDYMIYLLIDALCGIIPLAFLLTNQVFTDIPSLICILASIISVLALIIFEGRNMMSELKRRLHV